MTETVITDHHSPRVGPAVVDRIYTPGPAQVAYLVADPVARAVAVIDPRRDIAVYLDWARDHDYRIVAVLETHIHADFVSGGPALAEATGAPLFASRIGCPHYQHTPLDDHNMVPIGTIALEAIATPGHTPEHMAFLLRDEHGPPLAVFTGDALFVGEVGRPDLIGSAETERLVHLLYHTIHHRLGALPAETIVYPGHTAGSACGSQIGDAPDSTIGIELHSNYAFGVKREDDFVAQVLERLSLPPTHYPTLKRVNLAGAAAMPEASANHLSPGDLVARQQQGALVLDLRSPDAYGDGHIPNAIAVPDDPDFVAWAGWLDPYQRDLVLVVPDRDVLARAILDLRRIGIDQPVGVLDDMEAWTAAGLPTVRLTSVNVAHLDRDLQDDRDLVVLDVRSDGEWATGHIAHARHCFAGAIAQGAIPPISPDDPVAVICGSGYRSTVAASLLFARGYINLRNVTGGMDAWNDAGLSLHHDDRIHA